LCIKDIINNKINQSSRYQSNRALMLQSVKDKEKKHFWNIDTAWVKVLNNTTIIQHLSQTMNYKTIKDNCKLFKEMEKKTKLKRHTTD